MVFWQKRIIFFLLSNLGMQCRVHCKSSSDFGISKISTNSGGRRDEYCQLIRNQSRWLKCRRPSERSSMTLASRAGMICSALAVFGRDRTIWTRRASAMRSRVFIISFCSVIPGRSADSRMSAEYKPISVSLRLHALSPLAKLHSALTKSA